jgi:SagB-type dehydrogenase family enzyme
MSPLPGRYAALFTALLAVPPTGRGPVAWRNEPVQAVAETTIALPPPVDTAGVTLTHALKARRSVREFTARQLAPIELSRLLWAVQGVTHPDGRRTAPSAGALYPLEVYLATDRGFYRYRARDHRLVQLGSTDRRAAMQRAALGQDAVGTAPAVFVIAAVYQRTGVKYGPERGPRYVHMEVGHAAQNLLLQAAAMGLGAVPIGAFRDAELSRALGLPADHEPLYLIPVGEPRR